MEAGFGTNTHVELLTLWGSFYCAKIRNINSSMIVGDSKLLIDWANGYYSILFLILDNWLYTIKFLIDHFGHIMFKHIYR